MKTAPVMKGLIEKLVMVILILSKGFQVSLSFNDVQNSAVKKAMSG